MKKVLLFGGTTEGRIIADLLADNQIYCDVSVATEYGEQIMDADGDRPYITVMQGRLDSEDMKTLCFQKKYSLVIDATHPFAVEVSKNILESFTTIPVIRYERKIENIENPECTYFDSVEACVEALENQTKGNVLLTTGSKNLESFCKSENLRKRLFARVLPGIESLQLCYDAGLEGRQIIAMQGPFSKGMNCAQIDECNISVLVTKQSGKTGGTDTKIEAALEKGIKCFVIRNGALTGGQTPTQQTPTPKEQSEEQSQEQLKKQSGLQKKVFSLSELVKELELFLQFKFNNHGVSYNIILAGIGMGSYDSMTVQVSEAIKNADVIFGAKRMLDSLHINHNAQRFPYYDANDILPVLETLEMDSIDFGKKNVVVLFSGDTGFFSGATKFIDKAKAYKFPEKYEIQIMPGISSLSYLSAKLCVSWNDAAIVSLHGVSETDWKNELTDKLARSKKIFFITSGAADVQKLGAYLKEKNVNCRIGVGFQLSYENEKILWLSPLECETITQPGLYSGMIILDDTLYRT